jgi:uncharacterized protein (TIGR02145 family)
MKIFRWLLIIGFLLLLHGSGIAQEKYYLVFCVKEQLPGYAFISFAKEGIDKQFVLAERSWGYYTEHRSNEELIIKIGEIPLQISNEFLFSFDNRYIVKVTPETYLKAVAIKKDFCYKNHLYTVRDCDSFFYSVVKMIPEIKAPDFYGQQSAPFYFMARLLEINKKDVYSFTDPRDSYTYKAVTIGSQTWMAENLHFVTDSGSVCYEYKDKYCDMYGRMYNWTAAMVACPSGWHLPSDTEWTVLVNFVGKEPSKKLLAKSGWSYTHGTDEYGFTALPGGYCYPYLGKKGGLYFNNLGMYTALWSSTGIFEDNARFVEINGGDYKVTRSDREKPNYFISVRCIKD